MPVVVPGVLTLDNAPTMPCTVHISAAARLHFGLLAFGQPTGRQYGGAGVMIKSPRVELSVSPSDDFAATGLSARRVAEFAAKWAATNNVTTPLNCSINVSTAMPAHAGFGSGTQLGLSVAKGLETFFGVESQGIEQLSMSVGRGGRSAVGSYGFGSGGFIAENGRLSDGRLGELQTQCALPEQWRVVVLQRRNDSGLSGEAEQRAFAGELPSMPAATTETMTTLLMDRIIPAAKSGDLESFGSAVYEYGLLAGGCFAAVQGGPFASPEAETLVDWLRENSIHGPGQSSWGPTIFGFAQSQETAETALELLARSDLAEGWSASVEEIENSGASVSVVPVQRDPNRRIER